MTADLFAPLAFARGPVMANRLCLGPLTNLQSHNDGTLGEDEYHWLTLRAKGGFSMVHTCASHVEQRAQAFHGQLACFDDLHIPGLKRLADGLRAEGALSLLQLQHAGLRAPKEIIGEAPVGPSDDAETGARALSTEEVEQVIEAFIAAAVRAEKAGFDGVALHGGHGYLITAFNSSVTNRRTDRFGGSLENRARFLREIIDGIRARTGPRFLLGLRLSAERFGLKLAEQRELAQQILDEAKIDFLDMSLWDCRKEPVEPEFQGRSLLSYFAELRRGNVRLTAAGKLATPGHFRQVLDEGCDFAIAGKAGILNWNYPKLVQANADFAPVRLPVTPAYLAAEGLGPAFIEYMHTFKGFMVERETA